MFVKCSENVYNVQKMYLMFRKCLYNVHKMFVKCSWDVCSTMWIHIIELCCQTPAWVEYSQNFLRSAYDHCDFSLRSCSHAVVSPLTKPNTTHLNIPRKREHDVMFSEYRSEIPDNIQNKLNHFLRHFPGLV